MLEKTSAAADEKTAAEKKTSAVPASAFPVLCVALGVCVRTAELSVFSVAAFEACLPLSLPPPALQAAVDVCHAGLMWEVRSVCSFFFFSSSSLQ
jgi:hypothetical protein